MVRRRRKTPPAGRGTATLRPTYGPPHDQGMPTFEDNPPVTPRRFVNKAAPIRGPPIPYEAFTIAEFCETFRISEDFFFKLMRLGKGPRVFRPGDGRRTLISREAALEWRRRWESAAATQTA